MDRLSHHALRNVSPQVARPPDAALDADIGIVHLGLGAFHRAHQAILTQRALAVAPGPWAISGASLRSAAVRDALRPQDYLYTLIENDGTDERASVVGVLREALFAPEEAEILLARLAAPSTRIVTLTVTEKGYGHNPATGELDLAHPDIRADLGSRGPAALDARLARARADAAAGRAAAAGLTVLCCDNMASNGRTLRGLVGQFARHVDRDLAAWIEDEVRFPSSMVDRIVPAATPASLDHAASLLGLRDEAAVHAEAFVQWVIEDDFAAGRPALGGGRGGAGPGRPALSGAEAAAAQRRPFRHRLSRRPARQAIRRRRHGRSRTCRLRRAADAGGHRAPDPGTRGLRGRSLCPGAPGRFANRSLQHRTLQIAMDGSQKIPVRWLPVLREARRRGAPVPHLVVALAVLAPLPQPAGTRPAGSCRSTTRWPRACAPA